MHAILLKNSDPPALTSSSDLSQEEQIAPRVLFWELIIMSALGLYLIASLFFVEDSFGRVQAISSGIETEPSVAQLIENLKKTNLNPVLLQKITRDSFSVSGRMIALNGDNIQVFEYLDSSTATKESSLIAERYANSFRSSRQGKEIYIYSKDNLVIFYMGNDKKIISALNENAKRSVVVFP